MQANKVIALEKHDTTGPTRDGIAVLFDLLDAGDSAEVTLKVHKATPAERAIDVTPSNPSV